MRHETGFMYVLAKSQAAKAQRVSDTVTCNKFDADAILIRESGGQMVQAPVGGASFEVTNTRTDEDILVGDIVPVCKSIQGDWEVVGTTAGQPDPATKEPWIRFKTLDYIVDREVTVEIDLIVGEVTNPGTGNPYVPGETLTVYDPNNMWATILADCFGTAYYRSSAMRFEIETCSLPLNKLRGVITECLLPSVNNINVDIDIGSHGNVPPNDEDFWPFDYPNVMPVPPDNTGSNGLPATIFVARNYLNLDAIPNSVVTMERWSRDKWPGQVTLAAPAEGSDSQPEWVITSVDKKIARWVRLKVSSGTIQGDTSTPIDLDMANVIDDKWWDGFRPLPHTGIRLIPTIDIDCPVEEVVASFDPNNEGDFNANKCGYPLYRIISTYSAMMGRPDYIKVIQEDDAGTVIDFDNAGANCRLSYEVIDVALWKRSSSGGSTPVIGCDPTELKKYTDIPLRNVSAVTAIGPGASACEITYDTVQFPTINCGTVQPPSTGNFNLQTIPATACYNVTYNPGSNITFDFYDILACGTTGSGQYVIPLNECLPECPCGHTLWVWNESTQMWEGPSPLVIDGGESTCTSPCILDTTGPPRNGDYDGERYWVCCPDPTA